MTMCVHGKYNYRKFYVFKSWWCRPYLSSASVLSNAVCLTCLGYLCIGGNSRTSSECSSVPLESLSTGSQALVESLRESGEEVRLIRNVHTVVDTGELQLVQAAGCPAEVQTESEPTWCFHTSPGSVALDTRTVETTLSSAVLPVEGSTLIDLRNCDEFSIVHLEDMHDRSSQFMMLQTGSAGSTSTPAVAADTMHCLPVSDAGTESECEPVSQAHVPVEIVGTPAMFVAGNGGQWKRQLELPSDTEGLRHPADVDSGIWDMMQALSNVADVDSGRSDLFHTSPDYSESKADPSLSALVVQPSLQGVYKMFQIADGSATIESAASEPQIQNNSSLNSVARSNVRQSSLGGLEDALEPLAVVDFVVHRVEAETVRLERIDSLDFDPTSGHLQQRTMNHAGRSHSRSNRTENQNKLLVDSATGDADQNADCSDGSYEDDESAHASHEVTTVNVRRDLPSVQTSDSATNTPRVKKKHKDVVRVTSARFGRSVRRRVGARGRTSWKDPNSEARKSVSADVSRSSSLLDIEDGHQEMVRSSDVYSDPSPEHGECLSAKTASRSAQPFTSSPYGWRRLGPAGVESHELFTDGSSSTTSGPMSSGLGLFAEPDLLNFEKFPDWMRDLPDALLHVPLSEICIPGNKICILGFFHYNAVDEQLVSY